MKTATLPLDFGADVAKGEIVVACAQQSSAPRKIANRRAPLLAWLRTLPPGSRIAMEATGTYHELLAELAQKRGFVVYVLNPKDTRHYAKAMGIRGKTDRVDAELIARFVAHEHAKLHPWTLPTPAQRQLDRLLKRRAELSRIAVALRQSLQGLTGFTAELKSISARLDGLIARIDAKIRAHIEASPERHAHYTHLRGINGVGPVVGSALVNALERLPFGSADAFVAFTGLDPRPDESGRHRGRRRLSKRGPSELRRLLYIAAMAAARSKVWKSLYQHYREKNLPRTAVLVILARRIARTAWSIYTHKITFDPQRLITNLT
jgi:transposase